MLVDKGRIMNISCELAVQPRVYGLCLKWNFSYYEYFYKVFYLDKDRSCMTNSR